MKLKREFWGGGGGVISSLQIWKIQGGRGVVSEIPSVVGYVFFSGTTQLVHKESHFPAEAVK